MSNENTPLNQQTNNQPSTTSSPQNQATAVNSTLPDDFLRTASNNDQLTADAEFARQLQEEENRQRAQQMQSNQTQQPQNNTNSNQRQPGPNDSVGTRTISRLNVTVCEAKIVKSSTLLPGMIKMDPYARVRVGHSMYSTQTHVSGDLNPIWDRQIIATLPVGITEIFVELFDEKTFQEDKRIAFAVIQLPEEVQKV